MPHQVDIHVGQQLRALRILRGLTQTQLANRLGISFQQIQKYERGMNRISASKLYELMCILDSSSGFFFEGLGSPDDSSPDLSTAIPALSKRALRMARYLDKFPDDATKDSFIHLARAVIGQPDRTAS